MKPKKKLPFGAKPAGKMKQGMQGMFGAGNASMGKMGASRKKKGK